MNIVLEPFVTGDSAFGFEKFLVNCRTWSYRKMIWGWVPQALQFRGWFYEGTLQLIINHRNQGGHKFRSYLEEKALRDRQASFLMFEDVLLLLRLFQANF